MAYTVRVELNGEFFSTADWVEDGDDVDIVEDVTFTIEKDFSNNDPADTPEETATAGSTGNTFTIVVTNTGTSTADNVTISDIVPAELTVTGVAGTAGAEVAPTGDNNVQWSIPTLAAGASVTLTNQSHAGWVIADAVKFESVTRYNDGTCSRTITLAPQDGIILLRGPHHAYLPLLHRN